MKERIITLALAAAVTIGIAPAFAQVSQDVSVANNDNVIADCMVQPKHCYKRVFKKCVKKPKKVVAKPIEKVTKIETTKIIEKPVVIQQPAPPVVEQPAVVQPTCQEQPVIIDRFEKQHRSLIHLGLFPFSLFGR
jgi:hypothetical protein